MAAAALSLNQQLHSANDELAGTVRITASQPVACHVLPPVLAAMRQALPTLQVVLVVSNAVSNLLEREADIAVRMVRPDQSSLVAKQIASVGASACASRRYLAQHGSRWRSPICCNTAWLGTTRTMKSSKALPPWDAPLRQRISRCAPTI